MSDAFMARMLAIDPKYGTQAHQRRFTERMHELQRRAPCLKEHEHTTSCYPQPVVNAVLEDDLRREAAERKDTKR